MFRYISNAVNAETLESNNKAIFDAYKKLLDESTKLFVRKNNTLMYSEDQKQAGNDVVAFIKRARAASVGLTENQEACNEGQKIIEEAKVELAKFAVIPAYNLTEAQVKANLEKLATYMTAKLKMIQKFQVLAGMDVKKVDPNNLFAVKDAKPEVAAAKPAPAAKLG